MKNSILGKARWLRDVALATSKNNGARVAREWLKYAAMFVMLFTIGSGNVWGATSTLTLSNNNKFGTSSGSTKTSSDEIVTWKANTTTGAIQNTYSGSNAYNGQQFGTGTTAWTGTFTTSSISTKKITSVAIVANTGGSATLNVSVGGTTYTNENQSVTKKANGATPLTYTFSGTNTGSITITVSKTNKAFYLQSIAVTYEDAVPTTTVTASPESLDWGNVLQSSSQSTKTFDISGSNLTGNLSVVVTGGYSVSCGSSISVTSGTPNVTTITVTPPSTSTPGEKNGKVTISGGGLASNVEVNLTMTVQASHTVTWMVNGSEHATTQVADGSKPEIPSNPSSCDGTSTTFYGWSTSEWSGKIDDISAKTIYTSAASMPTVSGAVTYYAVFCKGGGGSEVLNEEFDNNQTTDASNAFSSSSFSNFNGETSKAYKSKYGGVKFGTSSAVGYITSKSLDLSKAFTVSIDACKYGSDAGDIEVTVGSTTKTISNSSLDAQGSFKTFVLEFDAATSTSTVKIGTSSKRAYIDNVVITTAGTASQYLTTCQACVAPTSVTITGTNKYLGGQTISLTAAPEGGTGTPSYQWQKKIRGVWTNLANDGSISGVTSNNLQISSCSYVNSGGYRCIVSTGGGCETKSHADDTNGYGVHVFSLTGGYSGGDWSAHDITWTSGTTGTATIHLNASSTYMFKVFSNNGYYYGNGENNYIIQPVSWDCGINNHDMRLFTGPEGDYTFTVNIEHGLDGSPYVNVQVGYPAVSHPSTGYIYISKWWDCYVHYWEGTNNALMNWGSDPKINEDRYTTICGNSYWYFPVIATYNKFIAKDKAGAPENTTGDQETTNHGGMYITHNGSNWVWGDFATYTIAYAGGDGSTGGPMASHTGLCPGSSQQLTANAFSKSGYNFSGWTANVDVKIGGSTVPAGTLITGTPIIENVQSNITLTAQWTATTYTITYNGVKPGAENTNPISYTVEDLPINLVAATHDQWRFDGWTDDNAGNADITTIPAGTTGNQSFTAHWTQRYAVTWYEESTPTIEYYDPGTTLQFPADPSAPASCSEKKFVGWMVGTITGETDDKPTFVTAGEVNDDAAYHAVWATQYEESGTKTLFNDQLLVTGTAAVSTPRDGWSDLSNVFGYSGNGVRLSSSKNGASMTVDLSGKELGSTLTITFDAAKYSSSENGSLSLSCLDDGANPTFTPASFTISNASWEEKSCTITNVDGKVASITLTGTKNQRFYMKNFKVTTSGMITKYKEYSTSCCDNNVAAPSVTATATRNSITLSWANVTDATGYKVTINGGTHEVTTAACTYTASGLNSGTDYAWTVIATYNPANYCGAIPTKNTTTTLSVYGVTYNKNTTIGSGTVTMSPMPSDASTYVVGENVTAAAKPATCTNSGYTFNGWNTEPDGTGTHVDAGGTIAMVEGGLTLYAEWVAKRAYYVDRMHGQGDQTIEIGGKTYHCYYGDGYHTTPSPSDQKSGDACQAPHYRFVRWLTIGHINADGTQKDTGGAVSGGVQRGTVTDGETYYAIWEEEIE